MEAGFKTGDMIEFGDDWFIVLENYGHSGMVRDYGDTKVTNNSFHWEYSGEKCILLQSGIVPLIKDCHEVMKEYHIDPEKYDLSDYTCGWDGTADSYIVLEFTSKENSSMIVFDNIHNTVDDIGQYEIRLSYNPEKERT